MYILCNEYFFSNELFDLIDCLFMLLNKIFVKDCFLDMDWIRNKKFDEEFENLLEKKKFFLMTFRLV